MPGERAQDFDYCLPPELVAQWPAPARDGARMLVLHRDDGRIEHAQFRDFPQFLREGDLAVLNDARVRPVRLMDDTGRIEILLLEREAERRWLAMVRPGNRMRVGQNAVIDGQRVTVLERRDGGRRLVGFESEPELERIGRVPLPPYIRRAADADDRDRYQTVFARVPGAVAAPTAGLHFTQALIESLPHAFVTLLVGPATFQPVRVDRVADHRMEPERYAIGAEAARRIRTARRVVAVGTTVVRTLEGCALEHGSVRAASGATALFIRPPFQFRVVGALLTNFHLPRSTLLMLTSAFGGIEAVRRAYAEAVRERYRFYSYGDCMLIV